MLGPYKFLYVRGLSNIWDLTKKNIYNSKKENYKKVFFPKKNFLLNINVKNVV